MVSKLILNAQRNRAAGSARNRAVDSIHTGVHSRLMTGTGLAVKPELMTLMC